MVAIPTLRYFSGTKMFGLRFNIFLVIYLWAMCLNCVQAADKTTYRVTVVQSSPYVIYDAATDKYTGLVPDILSHIANHLGVDMHLQLQDEGMYGSQTPEGNWTGMIADLVSNKSDIAAADLTVTATRANHIHFSHPYLDLGFKMLVKKSRDSTKPLDNANMFFRPFQVGVWLCIIAAYLLVSIIFYVIGRINPEELAKDKDDDSLRLTTSFFVMFSMLSFQGHRLLPTSISGRVLICFWWIFAVVTIASYTASLSAELYIQNPSVKQPLHFYTFKQLTEQTVFKYGCLSRGATRFYFKASTGRVEKIMNQYFETNEDVLVNTMKAGIERVRAENYAFIMESETAYYYASQAPCDLTVTGETLADNYYSFACRPNTDICAQLDKAIIKLQQEGELRRLRNRWMDGTCGTYESLVFNKGYTPPTVGDLIAAKQMDLNRFAVPLVLLAIGIVLSGLFTSFEIFRYRGSGGGARGHRLPDDKQTFGDSLTNE